MMNLTTAPRTLRPTGAACTVGSPVVSVQPRRGQVAAGASVLAPLRPPIPSLISSRPPTAPASGSEPPCSGRAVSTSGRALSFLLRCFSTFALAFRATVPLSVPARSSLPSSPVSCLAASVPSLPSVFGLRLPVCHPLSVPWLVPAHRPSAVLPRLLPGKNGLQAAGISFPHAPNALPLQPAPALWLGPKCACSPTLPRAWVRGGWGEDQEKAQATVGTEHSHLS